MLLSNLNNDSFSNCTNVAKLDLSYNRISLLWNVVLRSMPKLEIITLNGNNISYKDSSFPDDTFAGLSHLKSVSIWCFMIESPMSLDEYDFILQKLPLTLEELNVSIPDGIIISQPLSNFTKLRKLGISQDRLDTFNTITNDSFKSLETITIEELFIQSYGLSSVEPLAFYHFPHLNSLSIFGMIHLCVIDFYPALIGLQHTKLEILHLTTMSTFYGYNFYLENINPNIGIIDNSFCDNLDLPNLTHLILDHSLICGFNFNKTCLSKLPKLKVLNLSFNCFSIFGVSAFGDLRMLENLVELDISHQNYLIYVPYNNISISFSLPKNLASLDFSYILQPSEHTRNFTITIDPPPKYLNFQGNFVPVLQAFTTGWVKNCSTPLEADFSRNNMISFEGSFDDAILNKSLIVESLILSDNQLGKQMGERGDKIFKIFRNLTKLDLTSNNILTLPPSTFENLSKLEYLNLSKNSLLNIEFKISHMKKLELLDLSENLLSQLNAELQNDIDEVKSHSQNFTINMWRNPFQCSCETRSFLRWMYNKRSMFDRFDNYTCTYGGEIENFKNMAQLLQTIDPDCSSNLIIKVTVSLFALMVIVIAMSICVHRHKWSVLKFFLLEYITNRKLYREFEESEEEYEYDAFVSFHSEDQDWVWNELQENLGRTEENLVTDSQTRFRLCIHERDFVPGELIEENILRSIESSRKTIVVLSRNILKSAWCEFELQIARKECIERGRDLIIAFMLEPLPDDINIFRSVERLIRKKTYIEWPTEPSERILFWESNEICIDKLMEICYC